MLTLDELRKLVAGDDVDTVVVGFTDHYGRLVGKRYDAGMFVDEVAAHGTHGCDYLLTTDMEMEPVPGYQFANWELGYGDVHLVPDLPRCAGPTGSTAPRWCCATWPASATTPGRPWRPAPSCAARSTPPPGRG